MKLFEGGAYLVNGTTLIPDSADALNMVKNMVGAGTADGEVLTKEKAKEATIAYGILKSHNTSGNMNKLKIKFDKLTSHDITFVGIIQTARASGLTKFPVPYVLTNCHNSLCAVGGTINEDDHMYGLSCAKRYGGIYVPPHQAVIHQFAREMLAGCGKMILGSDSHTRYGALGTMAVGEGGPELVKQLLGQTYDINMPGVVGVYLTGEVARGVGPQDVALAIIGEVFGNGYVKNKVMEFVGPGVSSLSPDFRIGIDVMTTETTCLSSIWRTDDQIKEYLEIHGRADDYAELNPGQAAYYDGMIEIDLSEIKPMIAMPFHPSNTYTIEELNANLTDILEDVERRAAVSLDNAVDFTLKNKVKNGKFYVDQGIIAGCAGGGFENICAAADIMKGSNIGSDAFTLSVYPASMPVYMELIKNGCAAALMETGAVLKTAFCGPCFGAGDTPADNGLSVRHTTRNFENREGSKLGEGQLAAVALMDARSVAATAANGGVLTPATEVEYVKKVKKYFFDGSIYEHRVYRGAGNPKPEEPLVYGNNIADWPEQLPLADNLLICVASVIGDEVTTTDELIPSGETSSYRSNPLRLAEFALSRKDPLYVGRAKEIRSEEEKRRETGKLSAEILEKVGVKIDGNAMLGSAVVAKKPGDGSAREQAASCQRVLGGVANIALEYATKRYRSNLINWGMLPLLCKQFDYKVGDYIYIENIREFVSKGEAAIPAKHISGGKVKNIYLTLGALTEEEKKIILSGCLINFNKK